VNQVRGVSNIDAQPPSTIDSPQAQTDEALQHFLEAWFIL